MKRQQNILAAVGLAIGGIFGILGSVLTSPNLRTASWALDAVGLIVATSLLALLFFRKGNDFVAAGFLVFAIGEAAMLSGTALGLEASAPSFAAGIVLWAAALLLISIPRAFALWTRIAGIVAAFLFAIPAARIFWGTPLTPLSRPLPSFGYPVLVLTFIGWIWTILREP